MADFQKRRAQEGVSRLRSTPAKSSNSGPLTNARKGDLKGQAKPVQGNLSDIRNFPTGSPAKGQGEVNEPAFDITINAIKPAVEMVVVEVESADEADEAVRQLADRMGAVPVALAAPLKSEADSAQVRVRDQVSADRRMVLDVDEDRLTETKKRVSETVKETQQARRESAQQNRNRGGFGGGGFGAFGGASQSAETRPGAPPSQSQGGGQGGSPQQTTGQSVQQGSYQAKGPQTVTAPAGPAGRQKADSANKRSMGDTKSKQTVLRKRIEIIVRIKPKPTGKLEE